MELKKLITYAKFYSEFESDCRQKCPNKKEVQNDMFDLILAKQLELVR